MSPLFLLLVGLAALSVPSDAQFAFNDLRTCGKPFPRTRPSNKAGPRPIPGPGRRARIPRQVNFPPAEDEQAAEADPPPQPSTNTLIPVPYSRCGAVVIDEYFLLTAAYCVMDPSKPLNSVRLGDLDLSQDGEVNSRPADYDIEAIFVHPNFTYYPETGVRYSDLALLKTIQKIQFNEAVFPFCLSRQHIPPGTTVIASGFGYVNETHKATHLQEGELQVLDPSECENQYYAKGKEALLEQAYPGLLKGSGIVCAGDPIRGVCEGDEGGPLMRVDSDGRRHLEGIISFTDDVCGSGILPSISTSIADHYKFIHDTVASIY